MSKKKDLTIEEYKEMLLDEIEEDEEIIEKPKEYKKEVSSPRKKTRKKRINKISLIINIVFTVLVVIMLMITIDVISVARYNKGPFFAIKTNTYKDGGTKAYHGFGYKVIKYNQIEGRRDMVIGKWNLQYQTKAYKISALDLAIEFTKLPKATYEKYYKEFLQITGEYIESDKEKNTLTFGYIDKDGKYDFNIVCTMAEKDVIPKYEKNSEVTIIGTVTNYDLNADGTNKTLYVSNCFIK